MVQVIININKKTNQILNILKAQYGLKDKSQAINLMAEHYEQELLEPELRPQYIAKLKQFEKGKFTKFSSLEELRKMIE